MAIPTGKFRPGISRRSALVAAGVGGLCLTGAGVGWGRRRHLDVPLDSSTVAFSAPGRRQFVSGADADRIIPGTRVLKSATDAEKLAASDRAWLTASHDWVISGHRFADMTRQALLDMKTMLKPNGAALAAWSPHWRYVWPRDSAHMAAALSAAGHPDDAVAIMKFLQRAMPSTGWLESRYLPDGSGPPDGRERQLDNFGWVLWGAGKIAADAGSDAPAVLRQFGPLLDYCARGSLAAINTADSLPPASMDYWERHEDKLTLGIAAPLLAGLQAASTLFGLLDDEDLRRKCGIGARRLDEAIRVKFGATGYPRVLGNTAQDASVAMLLPPYTDKSRSDVNTALGTAKSSMERPNGGLAPGADWQDDGVAWTPETAMFAYVYAGIGQTDRARTLLQWLDDHRTKAGSLPEKVLFSGEPAAVAPLSWTAALTVLTIEQLRG